MRVERKFLNSALLFKQTALKGIRVTAIVYHRFLTGNVASRGTAKEVIGPAQPLAGGANKSGDPRDP